MSAKTATYSYDSANQLIRENNKFANKTWVWEYDDAGNILSKKEYAYTTGSLGAVLDTVTYTYGNNAWGDLLTAYDGVAISYDTIGNPLYDGTWHYSWRNGRELAAMSNGTTTWSYTYDANGMRTKRTGGGVTYTYVYNGGQLSQMTVGNNTLSFVYDATGAPVMVFWRGVPYYYITNLQGDVIAILDADGNIVVSYDYDAWGRLFYMSGSKASTLGAMNPLTYRGYVYDRETGLYYLQSRYYNPTIGRFINADAFASTGQGLLGNNMFAYCRNNPVRRVDISGAADADCIDDDGEILSSDELEDRRGGGGAVVSDSNGTTGSGSGTVTLYRAASPAEATSATNAQRFSPGPNSYESGKYFATSEANAQRWGDLMHKDGNYKVISATFSVEVTSGQGVMYWSSLDGVGPAYMIPLGTLNEHVISIICMN